MLSFFLNNFYNPLIFYSVYKNVFEILFKKTKYISMSRDYSLSCFYYLSQSFFKKKLLNKNLIKSFSLNDYNQKNLWFLNELSVKVYSKFLLKSIVLTSILYLTIIVYFAQINSFYLLILILVFLFSNFFIFFVAGTNNYNFYAIIPLLFFCNFFFTGEYLLCIFFSLICSFISISYLPLITYFIAIYFVFEPNTYLFINLVTLVLFFFSKLTFYSISSTINLKNIVKHLKHTLTVKGIFFNNKKKKILIKKNKNNLYLFIFINSAIFIYFFISSSDYDFKLFIFSFIFIINYFFEITDFENIINCFLTIFIIYLFNQQENFFYIILSLLIILNIPRLCLGITNIDYSNNLFSYDLLMKDFYPLLPRGSNYENVLFIMEDPNFSYINLYNGDRHLFEFLNYCCIRKKLNLVPDFYYIFEYNFGSHHFDLWGKEIKLVKKNIQSIKAKYIFYISTEFDDFIKVYNSQFSQLSKIDLTSLSIDTNKKNKKFLYIFSV